MQLALALTQRTETLEAFQQKPVDPASIQVGNKWGEAGLKGLHTTP